MTKLRRRRKHAHASPALDAATQAEIVERARSIDPHFLAAAREYERAVEGPGETAVSDDAPVVDRGAGAERGVDYTELGEHVGAVLATASEAADRIKLEARAEVEKLRAEATSDVTAARETARREVESAKADAEKARKRASEYAARRRRSADEQAAEIVARAEQEASERHLAMLDHQRRLKESIAETEERLRLLVKGLFEVATTLQDLAPEVTERSPDAVDKQAAAPTEARRNRAGDAVRDSSENRLA